MDIQKIVGLFKFAFLKKSVIIGIIGFLILFGLSYYGQSKLKRIINQLIDAKIIDIQKKYETIERKLNAEIEFKNKQLKELERKDKLLETKLLQLEKKKSKVESEVSNMNLKDLIDFLKQNGYDVRIGSELCKDIK